MNKILVTPEELIATSEKFANSGSQVNSITDQMLSIIRSLSSTWMGEASTAYLAKFASLEDDMARIYNMITEHVNDIQEIAKNYNIAESDNTQTSGGLPSDVIS